MTALDHPIPFGLTPFVGRKALLDRAVQILQHARLLTLTGPGGVGKSKLAEHVAREVLRHGDAVDVKWVDFGSAPSDLPPERLWSHLALAADVRHNGSLHIDVFRYDKQLADRNVILVFDNCEHLIAALLPAVRALLRALPRLRILATSREPLGLDDEPVIRVPPLEITDATTLFVAAYRAAGADPDEPTDATKIAELCTRLDGLPLAIRLAAGRAATSLTIEDLTDRFESGADRFQLLTATGTPIAGARHSTLEQVVAGSYNSCSPQEQQVWQRVAAFVDGFDLHAATAVAGDTGIDGAQIERILSALATKSVITVRSTKTPTSYRMLDAIKDFGLQKLIGSGESQRVLDLHRRYFNEFVERAATSWYRGDEVTVMDRVHHHLPDILAAVDRCIASGDIGMAHNLARNLVRTRTPHFRGFLDLAAQTLERVIQASDRNTDDNHATIDLAMTAATKGWVLVTTGRSGDAQRMADLAEELIQRRSLAVNPPLLFALGSIQALRTGNPEAIGLIAAARRMMPSPDTEGDLHMAFMVETMARAFADSPATAIPFAMQYLEHAEQSGGPWTVSWALWGAALVHLHSGDPEQALTYLTRCLEMEQDLDDSWGVAWAVELCAQIWAARLTTASDPRTEATRAAWLLGAAGTRREHMGITLSGLRPLAADREHALQQIHAVLDELEILRARSAGSEQPDLAISVALGAALPTRRTKSRLKGEVLSAREREVVELIGEGLTNAEIATQLHLAESTIYTHVRRIMTKSGIRRRAGLPSWLQAQETDRSTTSAAASEGN